MDIQRDIELNLAPDPNDEHLRRTVGDGITIDSIRSMVHEFYARIQRDELLGPIFNTIVHDWDAHYEKMTRFWSSATMQAGTYSGRPIEAHKFGGLTELHFRHWINLFSKTVHELFSKDDAMVFQNLGERMASSIAMRIGVGRFDFQAQPE